MAQTLRNIVVFGASGNIGAPLTQALLEAKIFNLTVVSRNTSNATFPKGVIVHRSDMTDEDLLSILRGQDAIVCAVGPTGFDDQKRLIDLAIKADVKRFLPSEFSIHTSSRVVRDVMPLFNAKWSTIEYLRQKEKEGLSWTGLATGFLFDWGMKQGIFGFNLKDHTATIWDEGDTQFSATNLATACQALVSILQNPEDTANQYVHVASFATSQNQILNELKAAGMLDWSIISVTTEDQIKTGREMFRTGNFMGMMLLVQAATMGNLAGLNSDYGKDEKLWNQQLGLPFEIVKQSVEGLVSSE